MLLVLVVLTAVAVTRLAVWVTSFTVGLPRRWNKGRFVKGRKEENSDGNVMKVSTDSLRGLLVKIKKNFKK